MEDWPVWCKGSLALLLMSSLAQADELCPTRADRANCVRVLACIGEDGVWFHGRAFGRGEGTMIGQRSDGTACRGNWVSRNWLGTGQADVTCDDGWAVTVLYTYQEEQSGTAVGQGRSTDGRMVQAWSGLHVLDYLNRETGTPMGYLRCGPREMLLGLSDPAHPRQG